ncbi:hypothetical protein [Streptomyces sp. CA-111067]|uniref:hypothetical protein n=1 Tax=Streptomyces sp. CA-111067 TaxID=3240046 RepID=UPI003D987C0B
MEDDLETEQRSVEGPFGPMTGTDQGSLVLPWVYKLILLNPPFPWDYLSPLMLEWTWQYDEPNTLLRELLAVLRDSRLTNWSRPTVEPCCILDDLHLPRRGGRTGEARSRAGRSADAHYAASLPRGRRVVLAALHAARGVHSLVHHERIRQLRHARQVQVPWPKIAAALECSRQAAQKQYGNPSLPDLGRWNDHETVGRFRGLVANLRESHLVLMQNLTSGKAITKSIGRTLNAQDRFRVRAEEGMLETQLYWAELSEDHSNALASLHALRTVGEMNSRVVEQLLYEAQARGATWDDLGLGLECSAQAVHQRYSQLPIEPIERGMRMDLEMTRRTAARILSAQGIASTEVRRTAERFIDEYGPPGSHHI